MYRTADRNEADRLRERVAQLTQLRDVALAEGNVDVAGDAIDAAHAALETLRGLYDWRQG